MARHYTITPGKFDLQFASSKRATVHGGQLAIAALLEEFGLWKKVKTIAALDPRTQPSKGFDPCVYVAAILFSLTSGGDSLADAERLNEDEALKATLGIERFPDQSAIGQWLRQISWEGARELRELNRQFVGWALGRCEKRAVTHLGALEMFFDDTQIEVAGKCFEGAKLNYEGNVALSWQTLWVGPFLADGILGSPSQTKEPTSSAASGEDVSAYLPHMIAVNRQLWAGWATYFYADSASSAGKYMEAVDTEFDNWSISYNKWTSPLEKNCAELGGQFWSKEEQTKWRDGRLHTAQYAFTRHQPEGCQKPKTFAAVRHKESGALGFWEYAFVACKDLANSSTAQRVFERHRLKGDKERAFSEVLTDLDLHHPPCQRLDANNCYYVLASLAFNALQALKHLYLPEEHRPKRIKTLIHHLLLVPVEIKRHARKLKAVFFAPAGWVDWWKGFLGELLPRCRQLGAIGFS